MTYEALDLDILDNNYAIAVSPGRRDKREKHRDFVAANEVFTTFFKGITNPGKLYQLTTSETENKTVIKYNEGYWEVLELTLNRGYTIHLLKNISYEMMILQRLKEQLKELTDTGTLYSRVLNKDLPIGVMIVDNDYNVSFVNNTLKRFFHIPSKAELHKCFNYVREIKPCENCILRGLKANRKKNKKTFTGKSKSGNSFITAEAHALEDWKKWRRPILSPAYLTAIILTSSLREKKSSPSGSASRCL